MAAPYQGQQYYQGQVVAPYSDGGSVYAARLVANYEAHPATNAAPQYVQQAVPAHYVQQGALQYAQAVSAIQYGQQGAPEYVQTVPAAQYGRQQKVAPQYVQAVSAHYFQQTQQQVIPFQQGSAPAWQQQYSAGPLAVQARTLPPPAPMPGADAVCCLTLHQHWDSSTIGLKDECEENSRMVWVTNTVSGEPTGPVMACAHHGKCSYCKTETSNLFMVTNFSNKARAVRCRSCRFKRRAYAIGGSVGVGVLVCLCAEACADVIEDVKDNNKGNNNNGGGQQQSAAYQNTQRRKQTHTGGHKTVGSVIATAMVNEVSKVMHHGGAQHDQQRAGDSKNGNKSSGGGQQQSAATYNKQTQAHSTGGHKALSSAIASAIVNKVDQEMHHGGTAEHEQQKAGGDDGARPGMTDQQMNNLQLDQQQMELNMESNFWNQGWAPIEAVATDPIQ